MTNKDIGTKFENEVKDLLEKWGWFVCRSAGSLGHTDLVTIKGKSMPTVEVKVVENRIDRVDSNLKKQILPEVVLISCKHTKAAKGKISASAKRELAELFSKAQELGATAKLATNVKSLESKITRIEMTTITPYLLENRFKVRERKT